MARGCFGGLFLLRVVRQAIATGAAMVGELGGRALTWKRTPESFGPAGLRGPAGYPNRDCPTGPHFGEEQEVGTFFNGCVR